jgi:hypothetical protein
MTNFYQQDELFAVWGDIFVMRNAWWAGNRSMYSSMF